LDLIWRGSFSGLCGEFIKIEFWSTIFFAFSVTIGILGDISYLFSMDRFIEHVCWWGHWLRICK
jgi:hypothetical protein